MANDLIVSREVFEDSSGKLALAQIEQAAFQPMDGSFFKGYSDSAFWLRLRIRPSATSEGVVLRVLPPQLDEIRLYQPDPARPGHWNSRVTGDRYAYDQRDLPAIPFEFALKPGAPDTTYYLRIKTTSTLRLVDVEALEPTLADQKNNRWGMAQLGYFLVMLFLLFWAVHDYAESRQTVVALYILYQTAFVIASIAAFGHIVLIAPAGFPELADYSCSVMICGVIFVNLLLHQALFKLFAPPSVLMRGFNLLLLFFPLELGVIILGHTRLALQINAMLAILLAPYYLVLAFSARRQTAPGFLVLRSVYCANALSMLIMAGTGLGLLSIPVQTYAFMMFVQGLIDSSLSFIMIHLRSRQLAKDMRQTLRLANAAYSNTQEGICITDIQANVIAVNPAFSTITEYSQQDVIGQNISLLNSGKHDHEFFRSLWDSIVNTGQWQGEIWDRRKNGEVFPLWLSISTIHDDTGNPINYVGVFNDMARIRHVETPLEHLAYYDSLTDLPNRKLLTMRLGHALSRAQRTGSQGGVLFIDLDRFKPVNDTHGHAAGDELLHQVARRLQERLRKIDTLARLGGDEFVILLEDLPDCRAVGTVAQDLIAALETPFLLSGGQEVAIGCSIGISLYPQDDSDPDRLLQQADEALYRVKRSGRGEYHFYSPAA